MALGDIQICFGSIPTMAALTEGDFCSVIIVKIFFNLDPNFNGLSCIEYLFWRKLYFYRLFFIFIDNSCIADFNWWTSIVLNVYNELRTWEVRHLNQLSTADLIKHDHRLPCSATQVRLAFKREFFMCTTQYLTCILIFLHDAIKWKSFHSCKLRFHDASHLTGYE